MSICHKIYLQENKKNYLSFIIFTLITQHGNSGNAFATALAPAIFVNFERPTKNSFPVIINSDD